MKRCTLYICVLFVLATGYVVLGGQGRCNGGPTITEIDPSSGVVTQRICIYGSGFGSIQEETSIIEFSEALADQAVYWSDNVISVNIPEGAGSGPATVTVNNKRSNEYFFTVTDPIVLTEEDGQEIYDIQANGGYYYQDLQEQGDPDALEHTSEWIATQPGVQSTFLLSDGETIRIDYESGLKGYIYTREWNHPTETLVRTLKEEKPLDPPESHRISDVISKQDSPASRSAIFLLPFQEQFEEESHNHFGAALQEIGFTTEVNINGEVDISLMETIDEYGVIYMSTHGFYDDIGKDHAVFTGQNYTSFLHDLWNGIDPALQAGIAVGTVIDDGLKFRVMLLKDFFNQLDYPNSFVIMHACYSLIREDIANAFIHNGAGVYFGWDYKTDGWIGKNLFPWFLPALLKDQNEAGQHTIFHPNRTTYEFYRQTEIHFPSPPQFHEILNFMMPLKVFKEDQNDDWKFCWYPYEPEEEKCMGEGTNSQVDFYVTFDYRGNDDYTLFPNQAPPTPENPNPPDGAPQVNPNNRTFSWDPSEDPDGDEVQYCLVIQKSPEFGGDIIHDGCTLQDYLDEPTFTLLQPLEPLTIYEWGVWAKDPYDYWSEAVNPRWSFTTGEPVQYSVPDTGITLCYDLTQEIECPAPGEPFYGQDAHYAINPMSYTDNADGTVTDNVTNLMWQQGGYVGDWSDALAHCEGLELGGHTDWRLPEINELQSIVNYSYYDPAIDEDFFPGTEPNFYWSSSTYAVDTELAWYVYFYSGYIHARNKADYLYIRCVRGETTIQSFTDNGNGTVTDNLTGIMWQQEHEDTQRDWEDALAHCEGLELGGHTDWRLPDIKELRSIVDNTTYDPAINETYFLDTVSSPYWSSSTRDLLFHAQYVDFSRGQYGVYGYKWNTYDVRCVR